MRTHPSILAIFLLVLGIGLNSHGSAPAMSRAPSHPKGNAIEQLVISTCQSPLGTKNGLSKEICTALGSSLPDRVQHSTVEIDAFEPKPGSIGVFVKITLTRVEENVLEGFISWTNCTEKACSAPKTSESVQILIEDAAFTPKSYEQFVRGLLTVAKLPL